jgi:protein-S-isoprenylcysteine O-methyltransferase Ste14
VTIRDVRVPDLGSRGQGWVYLQFPLMAGVVLAGVAGPPWPDSAGLPLLLAGAVAACLGAALGVWAARTLGRSFTPFPAPRGDLVAAGPYRRVRHPVYAAGLLFFLGVSLVTGPLAIVLTAALAVLWSLKLRVEERFLSERYPAYEEYCERVPARLVPWLY